MIILTNLSWPDQPFERPDRAFGRSRPMLVSFDVEWSKNYRVKNGNIPFCYSFIYMTLPDVGTVLREDQVQFGFKSVYVETNDETQDLIRAADDDLGQVLKYAKIITGHQLSSDISVLINAAEEVPRNVATAKEAWTQRKVVTGSGPGFIDTRYDIEHLMTRKSRRLVDVCEDLRLRVCQPEIKGSMTAMHRAYLNRQRDDLRERVAVLNLRHSLSQALVAFCGIGRYVWSEPVNVNRILRANIWDCFDYMDSPMFTETLGAKTCTELQ